MNGYERANLVKCHNCNFIFCSEIPADGELHDHYKNYPRFASLSPITKKRYAALLKELEAYRKTNNLMDLGCGSGLFLECAKEQGWNVYGTEFSEENIRIGETKGIRMFKAGELPVDDLGMKFDVVTSFEVIEHLNSPHRETELVNSILRPGGAFYITTPNFNAISRRLLKAKWNVIEYPEHLSYYTPGTLHKLLKNHGFRKKLISTTGFSVARFKESRAVSTDHSAPRQENDEGLRKTLENNFILRLAKRSVNYTLNLFEAGDTMKALYQKE